MSLGERIKDLRISKNLTKEQLAIQIGVSRRAIGFWEENINEPKASLIILLAKFFGVSTDFLLGLEDEYGNKINYQQ